MYDACANHIIRIGIDAVQQLHTESEQFITGGRQVQRLLCFKYTLGTLLFPVTVTMWANWILSKQQSTHPPKFFHLVKNDSPFISVGSKNLFKVSGSLTFTFCCTPLYRNDMSSDGVSAESVYENIDQLFLQSSRFEWVALTCIVVYTFCGQHLLNLCTSFQGRFDWLDLDVQF